MYVAPAAVAVGRRAGVEQPRPVGAVVSHGMWLWPRPGRRCPGYACMRSRARGLPVSWTTAEARPRASRARPGQARPQRRPVCCVAARRAARSSRARAARRLTQSPACRPGPRARPRPHLRTAGRAPAWDVVSASRSSRTASRGRSRAAALTGTAAATPRVRRDRRRRGAPSADRRPRRFDVAAVSPPRCLASARPPACARA
jgi:hypothetical protein